MHSSNSRLSNVIAVLIHFDCVNSPRDVSYLYLVINALLRKTD
jgi:hypothetical protein